MHPANDAPHPFAQHPRGGVHIRGDGGDAALIGAQCGGQKPDHIGPHQQPDRPGEKQPRGDVEIGPHIGVQRVVERGKRHQQPHGDHPAGHRVAQPRHVKRGLRQPAAKAALKRAQHDGRHHRQPGGDQRQCHRVGDECQIARAQQVLLRARAHYGQRNRRDDHAQKYRQHAKRHRAPSPYAA